MKIISYFFFYTYIGMVVLAGFWGAFINPCFDFKLLFNFNIHALPESFRINLLSQYRFLRALELGFGLFSLVFKNEIFNTAKFNVLFLITMGCGIMARIFSLIADGQPNILTYFFLIYELTGFTLIVIFSKKNIATHGSSVS